MSSSTPPLWKQALGAVVGGSLALVLYGVYEYGSPQLLAYLNYRGPGGDFSEVQRVPADDERREILAKSQDAVAERVRKRLNLNTSEITKRNDDVMEEEDIFAPTDMSIPAPLPAPVPLPAAHDMDAPELPSSGIEVWLSAFGAFAGSSVVHRKRFVKHLRRKEKEE